MECFPSPLELSSKLEVDVLFLTDKMNDFNYVFGHLLVFEGLREGNCT